MNVKFVTITPEAEKTVVYIARVSNPSNQDNSEYARLIRYCIQHQHWSIFEQASMTLEIETSRAISAQIIRHKSFSFEEFSQRYSDVSQLGFETIEWRLQAEKNRQSSLDIIDPETMAELGDAWEDVRNQIKWLYNLALEKGISKECARFVLPMCTSTRLYMSGTIRSWIHYIALRSMGDTQLEHRQVALEIQKIFIENLPVISDALGWK